MVTHGFVAVVRVPDYVDRASACFRSVREFFSRSSISVVGACSVECRCVWIACVVLWSINSLLVVCSCMLGAGLFNTTHNISQSGRDQLVREPEVITFYSNSPYN